jgi:hypothetical protein
MTYKYEPTLQDKTRVHQALQGYTAECNRIDIETLCQRLDMSRRQLRAIVHAINSDDTDHLILTDTGEGGYWLAVGANDTAAAVRNFCEEESRAINTMRKVAQMRRKLSKIYGEGALNPSVKLQGRLWE